MPPARGMRLHAAGAAVPAGRAAALCARQAMRAARGCGAEGTADRALAPSAPRPYDARRQESRGRAWRC